MDGNNDLMVGYNPKQYTRMTVLFVILSVLNMTMVLLAFMRSGYGLYHAEDALSHIAKITQCVQNVNENALNIVMHSDNSSLVKNEITYIDDMFNTVDEESEKYIAINLDEIDEKLRGDFDSAISKVKEYRTALDAFSNDVLKNMDRADIKNIKKVLAVYTTNVEPLKTEAEISMNNLFEFQSKSTYDFFVRCAQQFLFVLLFLIITMAIGITGIRRMKKNAKIYAEAAEEEHKKAVSSKNKAINIAYTNILTGLKNRYALEEDFTNNLSSKRFTVALFDFCNFSKINEMYGRSVADEFLSNVSQKIVGEFEDIADIYSTKSNEFCFVFKERMVSSVQTESILNNVINILSEPVVINDEITVQLMVACSYYECKPNSHTSFNKMFISMDRGMATAKQNSLLMNTNYLTSVNY